MGFRGRWEGRAGILDVFAIAYCEKATSRQTENKDVDVNRSE